MKFWRISGITRTLKRPLEREAVIVWVAPCGLKRQANKGEIMDIMFKCRTADYAAFMVESSRGGSFYLVEFNAVYAEAHRSKWKSSWHEGWRCDCPAFTHHEGQCKHIRSVRPRLCRWDQGAKVSVVPERTSEGRVRCPICRGDVVAYPAPLTIEAGQEF